MISNVLRWFVQRACGWKGSTEVVKEKERVSRGGKRKGQYMSERERVNRGRKRKGEGIYLVAQCPGFPIQRWYGMRHCQYFYPRFCRVLYRGSCVFYITVMCFLYKGYVFSIQRSRKEWFLNRDVLRTWVVETTEFSSLNYVILTSSTYRNEKADVGLIIKGVVHNIARRKMWEG